MKLTKEYLQSILDYNPETGILTWKINKQKIVIGSEAGHKRSDGYRRICIDAKLYYSHSIAFMIYTGKWIDLIDHKNQIRDDNRILNLIPSNKSENGKNSKKSSNNTSGYNGVYFFKRDKNWQVKVTSEGKQIHIGYFENIEDAIEARNKANVKYGFSKNHGINKSL